MAQFQVGEPLGRGGMGEVYAATDRMGRQVALKVLAPRLVQDRQHVTRFLQEARAVLALNHPNIVTVYDIGEADGIYYIASELIEGETLRDGAVARPARARRNPWTSRSRSARRSSPRTTRASCIATSSPRT